MSGLWLLLVAIICHSGQVSTAGLKVNQTSDRPAEHLPDNQSQSVRANANLTTTHHNEANLTEEKTSREKRGTQLIEHDFDKRDGQRLRFSSWAGKRSDDLGEDKRAKFSSWGGKRSDEDDMRAINQGISDLKRAKFSSWGGKRDYLDDMTDKKTQFSTWTGDSDDIIENKRTKFNSWAGKRTLDPYGDKRAKFSSWAGKRGKFNSWAGKRSDPDSDLEKYTWDDKPEGKDYFSEDKRAKFSSWAGKRTPDYVGNAWSKMSPDSRLKHFTDTGSNNMMKLWQDFMSRKRARFSSWAGKRNDNSASDIESLERLLELDPPEKRAKFSSWAGKRDEPEKRKFSSWGGKRDGNVSYGQQVDEKEGNPSMIVKRSVFSWSSPSVAYKRKPVFSSWGGKRSDSHSIQARSVPMQRSPLVLVNSRPWGSLMRPIRKQPEFYAWGGKRSV